MITTNNDLQESEFYPEYLHWKHLHSKESSSTTLKSARSSDDGYITDDHGSKCKVSQDRERVLDQEIEKDDQICKRSRYVGSKATITIGEFNSASALHEVMALTALQGLPGVPILDEAVIESGTPSLVMSYQSGTLLQEYIDDGDTLMSLLAFVDLCKVIDKFHKRGWAIYNLKADNVKVRIDKGKVRSTILDYRFCSPVSTNIHHTYYLTLTVIPKHLPSDVLEPYCRGDLVDRFSLCRLCDDICSRMPFCQETKQLRKRATRGLIARDYIHAIRRPEPRKLSKLANKLTGNHIHITWPYEIDASCE